MQRRLAAILFADIVGYSSLMGDDEAQMLAALVELRDVLFEPLVANWAGKIIKRMGDGWLVEYANVSDAVACAIEIQKGLTNHDTIKLRIGVHVGDITSLNHDVYGDGVNIAARLESIAEPGQVLISDTAYNSLDGKAARQFGGGEGRRLKNVSRTIPVWYWSDSQSSSLTSAQTKGETILPFEKPSIAVLPFDNLSGESEQAYFAQGIAQDLLTALSRSKLFSITAWETAQTLSGSTNAGAMGLLPNTSYLLRGSVQKVGRLVRVNTQLIDANSGRQIWADRYDGNLEEVFELQDQISSSVAAVILPQLTRVEVERTKRQRPEDLTAWDHYLKASSLLNSVSKVASDEATGELKAAISLAPEFSSAYALLARCYVTASYQLRGAKREREIKKAETAIVTALRHDPQDPIAYEVKASFHTIKSEFEDAVLAARNALAIDPSLSKAYGVLANALAFLGKSNEALDVANRGDKISPQGPDRPQRLMAECCAHFVAGDYESVILAGQKYLMERNDWYGIYVLLAASYSFAGRDREAISAAERLSDLMSDFSVMTVRRRPMFRQESVVEKLVQGLKRAGVPEK